MRQNYKKRLNLFGIVVILFGLPFLFNLKNLANLLGFFFGMVNHPCVLIKNGKSFGHSPGIFYFYKSKILVNN